MWDRPLHILQISKNITYILARNASAMVITRGHLDPVKKNSKNRKKNIICKKSSD